MKSKLDIGHVLINAFIISMAVISFFEFLGTPLNFEGNPEYVIGILAISSIVFGFWAVLIEREPNEVRKRFIYKHAISLSVYASFALLLISVISMFYTALNKVPYVITL